MEIIQTSISNWHAKLYLIFTVKYYSAMKRDSLLIQAIIGMNFKFIIGLSERSQTQEALHTLWFHFYDIWEKKNYRERKHIIGFYELVGRRGWQQRTWGNFLGSVTIHCSTLCMSTFTELYMKKDDFTICKWLLNKPIYKTTTTTWWQNSSSICQGISFCF